MIRRLLAGIVRGYVRTPGRSWVLASGALLLLRFATRATSGTKVLDLSRTEPGDRIVIQHLDVTHKQQAKDQKRARKAERRQSRG